MDSQTTPPSRILLASLPSAGLINPLLAMARELSDRGAADLWVASTEGRRADIEKLSDKGNVRFVSLGEYKPQLDPARWDDATLRSMSRRSLLRSIAAFLDVNIDHEYTDQQYRRARAEFERIRPDIAVVDLCTPWAIDAVLSLGIPFLLSVPTPVSGVYLERLPWNYPTPFSGLPYPMTPRQLVRNVMFRLSVMALYARPRILLPAMRAARRRKAEGLANPAALPSRYADAATAILAYSVFGLVHPFPAAPGNLHMVGMVVSEPDDCAVGDEELSRWIESYESVVYIGFGTIMRPSRELVREVAQACGRLGPDVGVLWKISGSARDFLPAQLSPNLKVTGWLPSQLGVLAHPRVRVFFNHGGGNAVHEGLLFGKPLLVLPFWMDCHDVAARVVESGAGLSVSGDNAAEIVAKIQLLLTDNSFTERADFWGRSLRDAGGTARAVDIILNCANGAVET